MASRLDGSFEERRETRSARMATGTLACPQCDAPVALAYPLTPGDWMGCPFCFHTGPARDFLSLVTPTRPARVVVRVSLRR